MIESVLWGLLIYALLGACIAGAAWRDARMANPHATWRPREWARAIGLGPPMLLLLLLQWLLPDDRDRPGA